MRVKRQLWRFPTPFFGAQNQPRPTVELLSGQLVTEAVREKLVADVRTTETSWMAAFGKLRHLRIETPKINPRIEEELEQIDAEDRLYLDTNALSALAEGEPALESILRNAAQEFIPVIVLSDRHGILHSQRSSNSTVEGRNPNSIQRCLGLSSMPAASAADSQPQPSFRQSAGNHQAGIVIQSRGPVSPVVSRIAAWASW